MYTPEQSIHLSRLQSTDEIDPLAIDHRSLDATQAAAPKTFGTHRVESLDALMPEDHRLFLPNDEMLDKFHNETVFKISAVVNKIMGATQNSRGGQPRFLLTVHSSQSFPLLECMFGTRPMSPEGLIHQIVAKQMQSMKSPIGVGTALRALIGAAVFEWVFQASQSSSPVVPASAQDAALNGIEHTSVVAPLYFQKREYSSTLEKLLSDGKCNLYGL